MLKFVNYNVGKTSNTSTDKMFLRLPAPEGIDVLFVTIANFTNLKGGIFSVGGVGVNIWLNLEPGTSMDSLYLRVWYV